jgi:hypothetical protein
MEGGIMPKRLVVCSLAFCGVLTVVSALRAQFLPEELAERPGWEEFLKTADIIGQEQIVGREAVTSPWKLTLKQGDVVRHALWKNARGRMQGYIEGWQYEISAYRIDKLLGLNLVPPTVERTFQGGSGSCQLWQEGCLSLKQKEDQKIKTPPIHVFGWNRCVYLQRAFDNLIANEDRHMNQILITQPDWRMILIDHSRSFRTSKKFTKSLIYTAKHPEGPKLMRELPRAFVEKLKGLTFDSIRAAVGEYLTDEEIQDVLIRRDLMLVEIDKIIKDFGEDQVLY